MDNNYSYYLSSFLRIKKETIRTVNLLKKDFDSFLIRKKEKFERNRKSLLPLIHLYIYIYLNTSFLH